jgi:hypothetical protein
VLGRIDALQVLPWTTRLYKMTKYKSPIQENLFTGNILEVCCFLFSMNLNKPDGTVPSAQSSFLICETIKIHQVTAYVNHNRHNLLY